MKKKTLLALIVAATMCLAACGGTEETAGSNVNEPIAESQIAESTETATQESQTPESTEASSEAPASEEAPTANEMSYVVSAVMMPDGSTWDSEKLPCLEYYDTPDYEKPYYTVTNTSNSAYRLHISAVDFEYFDNNFETGESITLPAFKCQNEDETYFWANIEEACESYYGSDYDIDASETPSDDTRDRVQKKATVTYDATLASDSSCPVPSLTIDSARDFKVDYIILYDEAGNAFNSNCVQMTYTEANSNINDCILMYLPTNSAGEPFTWASADIYYSNETK